MAVARVCQVRSLKCSWDSKWFLHSAPAFKLAREPAAPASLCPSGQHTLPRRQLEPAVPLSGRALLSGRRLLPRL